MSKKKPDQSDSQRQAEFQDWVRKVNSAMSTLMEAVPLLQQAICGMDSRIARMDSRIAQIEDKGLLAVQDQVFHVERRITQIEDWLSEEDEDADC